MTDEHARRVKQLLERHAGPKAMCCGSVLRQGDTCESCSDTYEYITTNGVRCSCCASYVMESGAFRVNGEWRCPIHV